MRDNRDLAIDEFSFDSDEGYDEYSTRSFTKNCNRCHGEMLHWSHTKEGWRLFTSEEKLHECNTSKLVLHRKYKPG